MITKLYKINIYGEPISIMQLKDILSDLHMDWSHVEISVNGLGQIEIEGCEGPKVKEIKKDET